MRVSLSGYKELLLVGFLAFISLSALGLAMHQILQDARSLASHPKLLSITPALAIGSHPEFLGNCTAPFTLVEFGDYQCPPCGYMASRIDGILQHNSGYLRFVFRNFPLTQIHPLAMQAALVAEIARRHGQFWLFHDTIYAHQDQLSSAWLHTLLQSLHLSTHQIQEDEAYARRSIMEDVRMAKRNRFVGTPTFLLITPHNRVYQLTNLAQLDNFLSKKIRFKFNF